MFEVLSCRVVLALMGMSGFMILYLLRINMSMAIVCMVKPPLPVSPGNHTTLDITTTTHTIATMHALTTTNAETESDVCSSTKDKNDRGDIIGEFEWNKKLQGLILSSFFYGYIVTQIPGGWLAEHYGGKHVMGAGVFVTVFCTLLLPVVARWSVYGVIALRVVTGLGSGAVFPAMHSLWAKWAPPLERSKLIATSHAGTMLGTISSLLLSGLLCASGVDNGWPLIFYVYGAAGLVWCILWQLLVYNSPEEHPRISLKERDYIVNNITANVYTQRRSIPWECMARSPAVWAIVVAHTCNNWGNYTILTGIPTYMREVLRFDIKQNGLLSAMPYMVMFFAALAGAHVADAIRKRGWFSTTTVRKIVQNMSFLPVATFVVAMGFMDCERRYLAVTFLTLGIACTAVGRSGYPVNHVDIAPRYAGILYGISNTAATIPGMVAPSVATMLTKNGTKEEWRSVFFICGGIYLFGALIYTICASGEEQAWSKHQNKQDVGEKYVHHVPNEIPLIADK